MVVYSSALTNFTKVRGQSVAFLFEATQIVFSSLVSAEQATKLEGHAYDNPLSSGLCAVKKELPPLVPQKRMSWNSSCDLADFDEMGEQGSLTFASLIFSSSDF